MRTVCGLVSGSCEAAEEMLVGFALHHDSVHPGYRFGILARVPFKVL